MQSLFSISFWKQQSSRSNPYFIGMIDSRLQQRLPGLWIRFGFVDVSFDSSLLDSFGWDTVRERQSQHAQMPDGQPRRRCQSESNIQRPIGLLICEDHFRLCAERHWHIRESEVDPLQLTESCWPLLRCSPRRLAAVCLIRREPQVHWDVGQDEWGLCYSQRSLLGSNESASVDRLVLQSHPDVLCCKSQSGMTSAALTRGSVFPSMLRSGTTTVPRWQCLGRNFFLDFDSLWPVLTQNRSARRQVYLFVFPSSMPRRFLRISASLQRRETLV